MQDGRLARILDDMAGRRVLVVGDVMLDEYVWGSVRRISPEAPVTVVEVERESSTPGGAANVAMNVMALGGAASVVGVVGKDEAGRLLCSQLGDAGVDVTRMVTDSSRPTTRKTRIIAQTQQVVRVDRESSHHLAERAVKGVVRGLEDAVASADIVVFSDYDKGMAGRKIAQAVVAFALEQGKRVVVNSKPHNLKRFRSASVITVNQLEAEAAANLRVSDDQGLHRAARKLLAMVRPEALIVTRGAMGMCIYGANGDMETVPAQPVEVYDVAGAGDTVVSTLALALASGASIRESAILANCAGGAVVRKVGVATVTRDEIANLMKET